MPFVHTKLANAHFYIEAVIVFGIDSTLHQELRLHVFVDDFAILDLGNELFPGLGIITHEALVPGMRVVFGASGSASSTDTDKNSDFSAWPFVDCGFVESSWCWIEVAGPVIVEYRLPDSDWLEGEADSRCCTSSLPDFAVVFRSRFLSRVVGAKQGGLAVPPCALVVCSDRSVNVSACDLAVHVVFNTHVLVLYSLSS